MTEQLTPLETTETYFPSCLINEKNNDQYQDETINNLKKQNEKLQKENTKFHTRIITLENNLKEINEKNYIPFNNTSINFFLPSEIKNIWETIALENIGDCFIDYFNYPLITFHLVQEMFYIMQSMIKEKINFILKKILEIVNIGQNENISKNEIIKQNLFCILKPFFQNYVIEIFDNEESKNNKAFNESFCSNFLMFYNQEIIPIISSQGDEDTINNLMDENVNMYEIVNSTSFKKMVSNIKKIILFTELNSQQLSFQIDDFITREISFDLSSNKDRDNLNVNGKTRENQKKLILINPPKTKNGSNYPNLLKIILPYDAVDSSNKNTIYLKGDLTSPGISLRSTSYQNIYHYTEKDENCKSQIDIEDTDNTKDENNKAILNDMYESSTSPVITDLNNNEKIRTERLSKFIQNKHEHIIFSNFFNKSHTRSLSKNSTIADQLSNGNNKKDINMNSYKKAKIYRLKRKGKNIQLEELKNSKLFEFNNNLIKKNLIKNEKMKINGETVFRNNTNSNLNPTNPMAFIKTNNIKNNKQTTHSKKLSNNSLANTKKPSSSNTKNTLINNKKGTKSNKSSCSTNTKKTSSVEKNIIEYKTNAVTKVNVDELLSCKNKKQFMDFRKTFVHTSYQFDNINL